MKNDLKTCFIILGILFTVNLTAQEISTVSVGKKVYEDFLKAESISTDGQGGYIFEFRDDKFQKIEVRRAIKFINKEQIVNFFETLVKVAYAPESLKTDDVRVDMTDYVNSKEPVTFIRSGKTQFIVSVHADKGVMIVPIKKSKKLLKIVMEL